MKENMLRKMIPMTLSMSLLFWPVAGSAASPDHATVVQTKSWDFSKDLNGWNYSGKWAYKGKPVVSQDQTVGKGALKAEVDYTPTVDQGWSEVKLGNTEVNAKTPMGIKGYNRVSFDFYYNPKSMTKGGFKSKLYMKSVDNKEIAVCPNIDLGTAQAAGDTLRKVHVTAPFDAADLQVVDYEVSLVGCNTDYKGALYVDNIVMDYDDGYVERTVWPTRQQKVSASKLTIPSSVRLTDAKAIDNAARLYAYMQGLADSDYVMYGHMNDLLMHAGKGDSDTYGMVGDYPAVIPIDAMTLAGKDTEYQNHEPAPGAYPPVTGQAAIDRAVALSEKAAKKGAIVSLSAHMPNFAEVAAKGKVDGTYDYSGFTSVVTSGKVVQRVLPGGDLNGVFNGYLDKIAAYGLQLQAKGIPVLFRPYHENNGSWFWWGAAHCSASEFKNLFRYTEEYLRDVRGVHNFIYVYSPNGPFVDESDYLTRYPGDAFIDIPGFDMYQEKPQKKDGWMDSFSANMDVVQAFAQHHQKLTTIPEAGILCGKDTLGRTGAQRKDWFTEALNVLSAHKMAYFSTWSNFNADVFDQPYMVDKKRGHEMVDGFTRFYNDPRSVFAGQMLDYTKLNVTHQPVQTSYAYLLAPDSNARVCGPVQVRAKAAGTYQQVAFAFRNAAGKLIAEATGQQAADGSYTTTLSQGTLDSLGKTVGTIEVLLDGKSVDSLKVFYNMPQAATPIDQVDTFESYYGDNELLKGAYSTNCGPGCSIQPVLTAKAGEYQLGQDGLDFHYKLAKGGWAGIIKSMNGINWSAYDGVRFWVKPDGRKQKLIIQINTDGEDFEVNLEDLAGKTAPQLVTLPFSEFKGKNGGTFNAKHIQHFAIYCNATGDDPIDSHFFFDDIQAVKTK